MDLAGLPTVLVVDDSEGVCASVSMLLEAHGFDVDSALSFEQALGCASRSRFHIFLIDAHLGRRSGVELARELLTLYPSSKAVLMTGSHVDDLAQFKLPTLQKPFTRQELLDCLRSVAERAA